MSTANPIQTYYAGCHFRSRLEARWAVFFDYMGIEWLYEPEGYVLSDGTYYLPDFYLPQCGTWVEVKGSDAMLDTPRMLLAALELPLLMPRRGGEPGPRLLILGDIPKPKDDVDFCWAGLSLNVGTVRLEGSDDVFFDVGGTVVGCSSSRFGEWSKNKRTWNEGGCSISTVPEEWKDTGIRDDVVAAYRTARMARFEHGETPRFATPKPEGGHRK